MLNQPSFQEIEHYSRKVEDNEYFAQHTNVQLPKHHDSNYMSLKYSPTLAEFQIMEKLHQEHQLSNQLNYLKFYWPKNTGIRMDLLSYLNERSYKIGRRELMYGAPEQLSFRHHNPSLSVQVATEQSYLEVLDLNQKEDLKHGKHFAQSRQSLYRHQFQHARVDCVLARLDGKAVGSLMLISSNDYLEIDNVLTDAAYRNQGVASTLLKFSGEHARKTHRSLILVVDAEDTPKEMYSKIGFESVASQISAELTV